MFVSPDWKDIALRLALTVLAGLIIGFNRGDHGRAAGMRTTLLVCLAASLSMILANLLMKSVGKTSDSFVVLDLMRLPLGILSGMGFIGAGTILRKGDLVQGVTTAATLWFVTVMGLCFGGGQIALGSIALILGWLILWGLKYVEIFLPRDQRGTLILTLAAGGPTDMEIQTQMRNEGCFIASWGTSWTRNPEMREISCEIQWRSRQGEVLPPAIVVTLRDNPAVVFLRWRPQGTSGHATFEGLKVPRVPAPPSPSQINHAAE